VPVVGKVEEDCRMLLANEFESITPDGKTQAPVPGPAARDAFAIFENLCLLGNGERLQLEYLHQMFTLEPIERVLTNYQSL